MPAPNLDAVRKYGLRAKRRLRRSQRDRRTKQLALGTSILLMAAGYVWYYLSSKQNSADIIVEPVSDATDDDVTAES